MRLLEFFNEAQEVELQNPGTLQKVLDEFLSFTAKSEKLPPELEAAEARCAVVRSRLDQSKEAGIDKFGKTPGLYGKMNLDEDDMRAIATAMKTVASPEDAAKLKADLQGMRVEGLSGNGFEGTGGHAEGFEQQNQGVTRRSPGEGPKANGGRSQLQQTDSYDQPQYGSQDEQVDPASQDQFYEEFMGVRDAGSVETQDPHVGSQEAGPTPMREVFGGQTVVVDPAKTDISKLLSVLDRSSSLFWKFKQVKPVDTFGVNLNASEVEELRQALLSRSQSHEFDDVISQLYEAKLPGSEHEWDEMYGGRQFVLNTEFGYWSVHQAQGKWAHVFYPKEGLRVPYADGYASTPGHAMEIAEKQLAAMKKEPPVEMGADYDPGEAWGQFPVAKRKPLMNSYDRTDEAAADIKDVPGRMEKVKARMSKLKKSSEKEKQEHPWASKKQAMQIAKDHEKLGEGVYRLTEFYAITEARANYYTIEPEANGVGRLLAWEDAGGEQEELMVHDVVASGSIDELLAALYKEAPGAQAADEQIRQEFQGAIQDGEAVYVDRRGGVDRMVKADKSSEKGEDWYDQYRRDNPNRYF